MILIGLVEVPCCDGDSLMSGFLKQPRQILKVGGLTLKKASIPQDSELLISVQPQPEQYPERCQRVRVVRRFAQSFTFGQPVC
jgi:hypothetical protein